MFFPTELKTRLENGIMSPEFSIKKQKGIIVILVSLKDLRQDYLFTTKMG